MKGAGFAVENNKGFSLVEILVCIVLLSIISVFIYRMLADVTFQKDNEYFASKFQETRLEIYDYLSNINPDFESVTFNNYRVIYTYKDGTELKVDYDKDNKLLKFDNNGEIKSFYLFQVINLKMMDPFAFIDKKTSTPYYKLNIEIYTDNINNKEGNNNAVDDIDFIFTKTELSSNLCRKYICIKGINYRGYNNSIWYCANSKKFGNKIFNDYYSFYRTFNSNNATNNMEDCNKTNGYYSNSIDMCLLGSLSRETGQSFLCLNNVKNPSYYYINYRYIWYPTQEYESCSKASSIDIINNGCDSTAASNGETVIFPEEYTYSEDYKCHQYTCKSQEVKDYYGLCDINGPYCVETGSYMGYGGSYLYDISCYEKEYFADDGNCGNGIVPTDDGMCYFNKVSFSEANDHTCENRIVYKWEFDSTTVDCDDETVLFSELPDCDSSIEGNKIKVYD